MQGFENTEIAFGAKSDWQLKKAYWLFTFLDSAFLTKVGNIGLKYGVKLLYPLVKPIIKKTIYAQFCGGETLNESVKNAKALAEYNIGSILDYSVEGQNDEASFDETMEEVMGNIRLAHQENHFPFVVFKPTGLGSIKTYTKLSEGTHLSEKEQTQWQNIRQRFETLTQFAKEQNVTLMVDAEESWMQDPVDDLVMELSEKYNTEKCVLCNTLQMYRTGRLEYLEQCYKTAKSKGFYIGFKVVRGAYMEKERERAEEKGYPSPIVKDKPTCDQNFDAALDYIVPRIDTISLFCGTHNEKSAHHLTELIEQNGLEKGFHKVWNGQLYGMSDNISFNLASQGYNIAKYLPYGPVKDVIPYLIRRADENTSVAGQSNRERLLIKKEMKRRKKK